MFGYFLLTMLGAGAVYALFDSLDNDADEDEPPIDVDPPTGETIEVGSGDTVSTGDGDDIITTSPLLDALTIVYAGGGDDEIETVGFGTDPVMETYAGDGNDTISGAGSIWGGNGDDVINSGQSFGTSVWGDAGDDTITAATGTSAFGGTGDDLLTLDYDNGAADEAGSSDGGVGDDTINVFLRGDPDGDLFFVNPSVTGGGGADQFTMTIDSGSGLRNFEDGDPPTVGTDQLISITDFDPAVDRLTLVPDDDSSGDYSGMELVEGTSFTDVVLTFTHGADVPPSELTIRLLNVSGMTAADIDNQFESAA